MRMNDVCLFPVAQNGSTRSVFSEMLLGFEGKQFTGNHGGFRDPNFETKPHTQGPWHAPHPKKSAPPGHFWARNLDQPQVISRRELVTK